MTPIPITITFPSHFTADQREAVRQAILDGLAEFALARKELGL